MVENVERLEAAEMAAWESIFAAAPTALAQALALETRRFGPALATLSRAIDNGQFNRIQGVGLPGDLGDAAASEAVAMFRSHGLKNFLVQIPPGPRAEAITDKVRTLGLVPFRRAWTKFARGAAAPAAAPTDLAIREIEPDHANDFGETAAAGFGMPPPLATWLSALVGRPGWRCYVAYDGDRALGAGAAFVAGDVAWLGVGATRPEGRGRGAQSAILSRRIADSVSAGARLLVTETGSAAPGEAQTSFNNILRAGFEPVYERANWTERPHR